jgi:4'-phosphopantetheinyl transferase
VRGDRTSSRAAALTTLITEFGDVDVWAIALDVTSAILDEVGGLLDSRELDSSSRFHGPLLRDHYMLAHAGLRIVLARYTGASPEGLRFVRREGEKPTLANPYRHWRYSLSHADDVALVAISARRDVGVDVERITDALDVEALRHRAWSEAELDLLRGATDRERPRAGLRLWTAKEAYLKCIGAGLRVRPSTLDFSDLLRRNALSFRGYDVYGFAPRREYAAAVACQRDVAVER